MNSADNLALLGRVMGGLVVVLVLIGLAARVARRARGNTGTSGLRVVDRVGLSREANLAVVEVGNRMLLLGVTAQGVTMLADLESPAAPGPTRTGPAAGGPNHQSDEPADVEPELDLDRDHEPDLDLVDREFVIEPEFIDIATPSAHRPVPTGIALDQYPDLASALRAAGRTTESSSTKGTSSSPAPTGSGLALAAASPARMMRADSRPAPITSSAPRTRAQARAEARSAPTAGIVQTSAKPPRRSRIPFSRKPNDAVEPQVDGSRSASQVSGSVLSPHTWRQGVDALRDLTVRRG